MVIFEKVIFLIGGSIGLLVTVSFFDAFFVTTAGIVSPAALTLLQLISFVMAATLVIGLFSRKKEENLNGRNNW